VETIFATNALGPYLLTKLLTPLLENTPDPPARVICMASTYAGMLDVDDLFFMKRRYDNNAAYRQSMQVVRMVSKHFADYFCSRAQPEQRVKVVCNAVMPGLVQTKLLGDLGLCGGQGRVGVWGGGMRVHSTQRTHWGGGRSANEGGGHADLHGDQ
jgi:NAD(P)-dependent dehydrogenase (short-subunit alcohol dehydrogenase family)